MTLLVGGVAACSSDELAQSLQDQVANVQAETDEMGDAGGGPSAGTRAPAGEEADPSGSAAETAELTGEGTCTLVGEERFTCKYSMPDDRVSGTETFTALPDPVTGETGEQPAECPNGFNLRNDGGQWLGALSDDTVMTLFWCPLCGELHGEWEVDYIGTGAYEGLEYHERVTLAMADQLREGSEPYSTPLTVTGTIEAAE
jgi:hypothetical protein